MCPGPRIRRVVADRLGATLAWGTGPMRAAGALDSRAMEARRIVTKALAGTIGMAVMLAAAGTAEAKVRTCKVHGGKTVIRTNEDECGWPRVVASAAIESGFPRKLDLSHSRYNRSHLRRGTRRVRVRYTNRENGMFHRITTRIGARASGNGLRALR